MLFSARPPWWAASSRERGGVSARDTTLGDLGGDGGFSSSWPQEGSPPSALDWPDGSQARQPGGGASLSSPPTDGGEHLEGQEQPGLGEGSQHLGASCYPSTCVTDVLLSYRHPELPFGVEQAGV